MGRLPKYWISRISKKKKILEIKATSLKAVIKTAFEELPNNRFHIYFLNDFSFQEDYSSYVRVFLFEDDFFPILEFAFNTEKKDYDDIFSFFHKFNEKCNDKNAFTFEFSDDFMSCTNQELFDFVFNSEFHYCPKNYPKICKQPQETLRTHTSETFFGFCFFFFENQRDKCFV